MLLRRKNQSYYVWIASWCDNSWIIHIPNFPQTNLSRPLTIWEPGLNNSSFGYWHRIIVTFVTLKLETEKLIYFINFLLKSTRRNFICVRIFHLGKWSQCCQRQYCSARCALSGAPLDEYSLNCSTSIRGQGFPRCKRTKGVQIIAV